MSTTSRVTTTQEVLPTLAQEIAPRKQRSLWGDAWRRLIRNKLAIAGLTFIIIEIVLALFAPLVAPYRFDEIEQGATTQPPTSQHYLGTDGQGRDVLSRVIYGARVSLTVGICAELIRLLIGVPLGLIAGFYGRWADTLLMRIVDVMYAFPDLLLMIILMVYLRAKLPLISDGPALLFKNLYLGTGGIAGILLGLAITSWLTLSRLVRGEVLSLRRREFIEAAQALGASNRRIIWQHLLPNALSPIIISSTIGIPTAILAEAGLSFIGIGVNPPTPSWGAMIFDGLTGLRSVPHMVLGPALALALTVLSFNFLGDGLRDALDPRASK